MFEKFIVQNAAKLIGWFAFGLAAYCFFGFQGVGVVSLSLTAVQVFAK